MPISGDELERTRKRTTSTNMKLLYLDRLSALLDKGGLVPDVRGDIARRAQSVCDSIENDLGLREG
ncbi:hypothetical protein AWJ19_03215 [Paenibacillus sp. DMB5]|nr:hypothetical protein AWJ19_03215 [Paenibacillus sp. DMB5]